MPRRLLFALVPAVILVPLANCKNDEPPPPPPEQETLAPGEACDPSVLPVEETPDLEDDKMPQPICAPGLACEPLAAGDGYVCGAALSIRGRVTDSATGAGIDGALVAALNEIGEPVTDVVGTDSCGEYRLPVRVRRNPDGSYAESLKWTLSVSARNYQPFPTGPRPALPVDMNDVTPAPEDPPMDGMQAADTSGDTGGETYVAEMIRNAATSVSLISLGGGAQGVALSGSLGDGTAGTLVVAEGGAVPAPYAIADRSGNYTLFNVPAGAVTLRGYRQGVQLAPLDVTVGAEDMTGVDLSVVTTDPAMLATVTGSLNIVNADGGSMTSVVLVPASVYNEALERGPVPLGLRDPPPPAAPDVTGMFSLAGVPSGTYKVLVAFENDLLVRDPDEGIAGTQIQEITVDGAAPVAVADAFKVTQALAIEGPGADGPEAVDPMPNLVWADDSSEDGYSLVVFDALGNVTWELDLPSSNGSPTVSQAYAGPALEIGMYYQFRVTSWRTVQGNRRNISRTEDLRGVFVHGEAPPTAECVAEDPTGGAASSSSGGSSSSS